MKPSATQIFRSDSPPTWFLLLGSCLFIGFLNWALIPMHYVVDFKVDWPKLLFKSRPQIPCHDIIHVATSISCRDINSNLCSLQLMFMMSRPQSLVATSLYAFTGVNWSPMMSRPQSLVATSAYIFGGFTGCFRCRDFSPLSRQQLQLTQLHPSKPVIASRRFSCRDITMLS